MNYIQLAQAVKRESGMSGTVASVITTISEDARIVQWVDWATRDIVLAREDWRFRRGTATAAAATAQASDPAVDFSLTDFVSWKKANQSYAPSAYRVSDGESTERRLQWMTYDQFRMTFMVGSQSPGAATYWSISPEEDFLLGPAPDSAHFIRADYIKGYQGYVDDTSTPQIPERFHMLIVWRALMEYAGYDAASETYQRAEGNYRSMWTNMVQTQLDTPGFAARSLG